MPDTLEIDCFFFQWSLRTLTIFHHSTEFRELSSQFLINYTLRIERFSKTTFVRIQEVTSYYNIINFTPEIVFFPVLTKIR